MSRILRLFGSACLVTLVSALPAPELIDDESLKLLSAKNAYGSASAIWSDETYTTTLSSQVYTELDTNVEYTTLCDGRARALETRYTTSVSTINPPGTAVYNSWMYNQYTVPSPTCTIARAACTAFIASYDSAISDFRTNGAPSPTLKPQCTPYQTCKPGDTEQCRIYGYGGNLYYWPVTTTLGDFCAYNGSTIFASPTNSPSPNTVVMDGHTFTSPTNYAQFSHLEAFIPTTRGRRVTCGATSYDEVIVPLTESFYSIGSRSFNFEDLNTVPAAAYERQRRCNNGRDCTTLSDFYTPIVPLPTEVLNLQPKEWKEAGCAGRENISGQLHMTPVPLVTPPPKAPGKVVR